MKKISYDQQFSRVFEAISGNGAFLTVKALQRINTMTIGWATLGYIWNKPILMVAVRKSRYTYNLIESSDNFTVSVPFLGKMRDELKFCGTKSGRNYDKFEECNLQIKPAHEVESPLITNCDIHYECKIRFKQEMKKNNLDPDFQNKNYPENDYHTLYFGEIVNTLKE
ncbi:MAG: flavin reductase family protein [Halanaerobiales bacterium]